MTERRAQPRLLMLLHGFFPMEVRVAAEVRAAIDEGFEVDVIALRRPGDVEHGTAEGATFYRLPIDHRQGGGAVAMVREYLGFTALATVKAARLARRRRYDVVQVHNPPDFLVVAALAPRMLGARIVFDVHDLASDMFNMRFEGMPIEPIAERLLRGIERLAARLSAAVLTVHEPYRRELIARGVDGSKITVLFNAVDERLLPPPAPRVEDGFVAVYHGTVTPHYGVPLIIDAIAEIRSTVPDLSVRIYGEGDALPEVRRRAVAYGVGDCVWVSPGHLPQREVLRAIQGASVGIVPNLPTRLNRFALSTKLFEYVAVGVPVVCSDLPTIREHFSEREVLFFEAGNSHALAQALEQVARDPEAAQARAQAARLRYEQYRWPVSAKQYVEVLGRLTHREHGQGTRRSGRTR